MKSFCARGVMWALGTFGFISQATAQYPGYSSPSMLPAPPAAQATWPQPAGYRGYNVGYQNAGYANGRYPTNPGYYAISQPNGEAEVVSPSDRPVPMPQAAPSYSPAPAHAHNYAQPNYAVPQYAAPNYGGPGCANCNNPYDTAMQSPYDMNSVYGGSCGGSANNSTYGLGGSGMWFGTANGLIMTRNHANNRWLSYDDANPSYHLLNSNQASMPYVGGFQTSLGRYFNCGSNAVEMTYWQLFPGQSSAYAYESQLGGGNLATTIPYDGLVYDRGAGNVAVTTGYNDAAVHRVIVRDEFNNVEANVWGLGFGRGATFGGGYGGSGCGGSPGTCSGYACGAGGCGLGGCDPCGSNCGGCSSCDKVRLSWLTGVRYFRFSERFSYESDLANTTWAGDADEICHHIRIVNSLVGFQVGGRFDYCVRPCWTAYGVTKVGVYGNQISQRQQILNSLGYATVDNAASPFNGDAFNVYSTKNDVAMLAELDFGTTYRFSRCWSANLGYRAIALTGVALPTNQFPTYWSDLAAVRAINSNGSMILHGAYAGINYNW